MGSFHGRRFTLVQGAIFINQIFRTMMLSTMTVQINQVNNNNQNCEEATNDLNDCKKEKM